MSKHKAIPEFSEAQIRIIKAAPKMLAQLEKTLVDIEDFCTEDGEFEWTPAAGWQICRELEKVIAEAR